MLYSNMVSFTECKKILNKGGLNYSDEEIQSIKELLECFVQSTIKLYNEKQNEKRGNNVSCQQRRTSKRV